ncbi:uncharacterized protein LOC112516308 [Cynara cardunculus var. scolymus]|uniref:uncharacterized protein LOC112516308 n=1 Tax=Cynara cardunculus var. scolymus TaxID=59895 RepID=UPI000D625620|nr:uncharacterized protein LOC112516308 [Cynara cardunculus var. scolymus]
MTLLFCTCWLGLACGPKPGVLFFLPLSASLLRVHFDKWRNLSPTNHPSSPYMEVQLITPSPAVDFNYDSASTSPYATAPSSPQSTIPFIWEEKPGIPKQNNDDNCEDDVNEDTDFAFGNLERHSISAADELFDCGKIKPLKPPPRLHFSNDSPKSPKSPKLRFKEALSPRSKKKDFDPFSEALKQTSGEQTQLESQRGRERTERTTRHKGSRSLSPFRDSDLVNDQKNSTDQSSPTALTWYNKWNLKNLLLFRSASEGNVTTRKDTLKKYTMLKKNDRDVKTFSFRSNDSGGSGGSQKVSADEINLTANKAVAEEMRKKTTLPHKSGLMGCLRFHQNAGSVHEISRGINSVMKQQRH